ncbi:hypothetical protein [Massilia sp. ST3]|uniref:hypothetical protein n=1 Tax=Massilia sp. ST3 TaxID=2824903 RepID=UPI001B81896A|nr:hypothetical protein [Massilia sp. ST3]MBQ5947039.1 hypothetical protein [Massilia sp. ST3]
MLAKSARSGCAGRRPVSDYVGKNKETANYNQDLVTNMINKRREYLEESKELDQKLKDLVSKI